MTKNKNTNVTIAENIRKYRNIKGISHEELEALTNINYNKIVQIETGKLEEISIQDIEAIAEALDTNVENIKGTENY